MTHHGTPLKHMGLDLQKSTVAGARMDFAALMRRCARWDYSVSANEFSTLVWERVYPLPYESLEVGYPRNDVLANAGEDDVRRIRAELGIRPDQQAVLYAPTHREYRPGYVPVLDVAAVADALGPDHVLMARLHYFYDSRPAPAEAAPGGPDARRRGPSFGRGALPGGGRARDRLLLDHVRLRRAGPPDRHPRARLGGLPRRMRGTYFDLWRSRPAWSRAPSPSSSRRCAPAPLAGPDANAARAAFRARFCSLEDGHAAERVVRRVWLGERAAGGALPLARVMAPGPRSPGDPRRRRRPQRHEPVRGHPRPARASTSRSPR